MKKRPIALAVAVTLSLNLSVSLAGAPPPSGWLPAPEGVETDASYPLYNARAREFRVQVQVENQGAEDLTGGLRVVVSDSTLPVEDADGTTAGGDPYFYISDSAAYSLMRGETSIETELHFGLLTNPLRDRRNVRYTLEVEHNAAPFLVQLLHVADIDGKGPLEDVRNFSALVDFFQSELPNTLTLSSGDNWIPGVEYDQSADASLDPLLGTAGSGRAHVEFLNLMGFEASAMGNHDLDGGTDGFVSTFAPDGAWSGGLFPYLSTNLDFFLDADIAPLVTADGQEAGLIQGKVAGTATITVNGRVFGIVGASTPKLDTITATGDIGIRPADPNDIDALAAEIQTGVDSLLAMGVNKIILLAHMQQIDIEKDLATKLRGVDIIVAGGSNTRLLDDVDDVFYPGDTTKGGVYPLVHTSASGEPVLVVNTDGDYKYLGRLVLEFDGAGLVDLASLDPTINGAYATDDAGLARLGLTPADADPDVVALADALQALVDALTDNVFGFTSVFLNGARGDVRTQETNLGDLTADANLWLARQADDSVQISLKNGGGIRDDIGQRYYPPGSYDPADLQLLPPNDRGIEGEVNQYRLGLALRFNNELSLVTVTAAELSAIIEHGVSATADGVTPGQFPQVGGIRFSFDPALAAGSRVQSLAVVDESGAVIDKIVEGGALVGDPARSFRMVTLNFLANGGDGYPIPATDRVDLVGSGLVPAGAFNFTDDGSEQDALAEYLFARYNTVPFDIEDTNDPADDFRIQNLSVRADEVFMMPPAPAGLEMIGELTLNAAEISAYDPVSKHLFVTDSDAVAIQVVDLTNPAVPLPLPPIDLSAVGDTVTSVAVKNGVVAAAVVADPQTDPGTLVLMDTSGAVLSQTPVGALPDMVTFNHAGDMVLVANEGEPDGGVDPEGSVSIVDISAGADAPAAPATAAFTALNGTEDALRAAGVRIFPGKLVADDVEPEYIAVSDDDATAYVSLQEANSLAVVDIATATVTDILPFGLKDHSLLFNALDASDRDDAVNIQPWPVMGMYMPDGIATFMAGGESIVATANEGDARDADDRIKDLTLDTTAFPNAGDLQQDEQIGRLDASTIDGDTDGDGDIDVLHSYGARSFTLWTIEGAAASVAWDSEDSIARITNQITPDLFNANDGDPDEKDNRSDNKGAEPEGVTIATINDRKYAFVVLERAAGGVLMYDVTNPYAPSFMDYEAGAPAHVAAEQALFIPAADSPDGNDLLVTSNEETGTIAVFRVDAP